MSSENRAAQRRALTQGLSGAIPLVVYQWEAWDGFMIDTLAPHAIVREASPTEDVVKLLDSLPSTPGVFLFHLNVSITESFPLQRHDLIAGLHERGWITCNEQVTDISKQAIQARLMSAGCRSVLGHEDGSADELMIIKSNYNYGGEGERKLPEAIRSRLGIEDLPSSGLEYATSRRDEIPGEAWRDPSLTIERFVGNKRGHYCRAWIAGERTHLIQLSCPDEIKTVGGSQLVGLWNARFDSASTLPDPIADGAMTEVIRGSNALALDFGAIDVMLNEAGEPFIVDVNTTPWGRLHTGWEVSGFPDYVHHLSAGSAKALSRSKSLLRPLRILLHSLASRS